MVQHDGAVLHVVLAQEPALELLEHARAVAVPGPAQERPQLARARDGPAAVRATARSTSARAVGEGRALASKARFASSRQTSSSQR